MILKNYKEVITVKNMFKKFGDFTANDNLNFEVYKGEIFGFLGANGAGKTTAIKILCGLTKPTSGEVNVAGFNVNNNANKVKRKIGYMSQKFSLYNDLTILENIRFYAGIYGLKSKEISNRTEKLINKLDLQNIKNCLVKDLPVGWRQKLAFSIAVFHEPEIVFLDEPTAGVDPLTRRQFWDLIYEAAYKGTTIFVTTHYMDEAEYCNRVTIMVDGKIVALDTPKALMEKYNVKNLEEVFLKLARSK